MRKTYLTHGGKREGAGRKSVENKKPYKRPGVQLNLTIDDKTMTALTHLMREWGMTKSEAVAHLINQATSPAD